MIKDDAKTKELQAQLESAQKLIVQLTKENKELKADLEEQLPMFEDFIMKAKRMVRWSLPLHRQVKNLYWRNREIQTQNRALKEELQLLKIKVSEEFSPPCKGGQCQ